MRGRTRRFDEDGTGYLEHGLGRVVRISDARSPGLGWPGLFRKAADELERLDAEGLKLDDASASGRLPGERSLALRFEDFGTSERVEETELPEEDRAFLRSRGFPEEPSPDPLPPAVETPEDEEPSAPAGGQWLVDRIDFVGNGVRCHFCSRPLRSRAAHWVTNGEGAEVPCGPKCVHKHAVHPDKKIPVFTKASFEAPIDEGGPPNEGSAKARSTAQSSEREGNGEIEYLRLRVEKLSGFSVRPTPKLDEIYERHRAGRLYEGDVRYLSNLASKLARECSRLSSENLQSVYAYALWMQEFLREEPEAEHVGNILEALKKSLTLTPNQIESVNKWFANRPGWPRLDPGAFSKYRNKPR